MEHGFVLLPFENKIQNQKLELSKIPLGDLIEYKRTFDFIDETRSGKISKDRIQTQLASHNIQLTPHEVDILFSEVDPLNTGFINFDQFLLMITRPDPKDVKSNTELIFENIDVNKDGKISLSDLKIITTQMGEKIPDDLLEAMINFASAGKDEIYFEEFKRTFG